MLMVVCAPACVRSVLARQLRYLPDLRRVEEVERL